MAELATLLNGLTSGDLAHIEMAVRELPAYGDDALDSLGKLLDDPDPDTRWWATRALAEFDAGGVGALLNKALGDPDSRVQQCAALALRERPSPEAVPALVALLGHEDRLLARLAGDALIAIGEPATLPLLQTLEEGTPLEQVGAARVLAYIGDLRSVSALFKLLDSDSAMLEHWSEVGLEKMGIGMTFYGPES